METSTSSAEIDVQRTPEQIEQDRQMKRIMIGVIIRAIVLLIVIGLASFFPFQPSTPTGKIRDVFIIVVAVESAFIGVALVVLVVQLASLINLLQNEVRPILKATNETVNNLRGTAEFLG